MRYNICFNKFEDQHIDWNIVEQVLDGYTIVCQLPPLRIFTIECSETEVGKLNNNQYVKYIEKDVILKNESLLSYAAPDDTRIAEQWALFRMDTLAAHEIQDGDPSIVVAIVDTGLLSSHEEFSAQAITGYSSTGIDLWSSPVNPHGTECASCISPSTNNGVGVAGVAPGVSLMPVRISNTDDNSFTASLGAEGILIAQANGANIISFSAGSSEPSQAVYDAITTVTNAGCLFIKSAGNNGDSDGSLSYPIHPEAMMVGSININNKKADHSSWGEEVDILAPGEDILVATTVGGYRKVTGTSFACPHVAAVAGLVVSENPALLREEVYSILRETSTKVDDSLLGSYFPASNMGCVNAFRAVNAAVGSKGIASTCIRLHGNVSNTVEDGKQVVSVSGEYLADISAFGTDRISITQNNQYVYRGAPQDNSQNILCNNYSPLTLVSE